VVVPHPMYVCADATQATVIVPCGLGERHMDEQQNRDDNPLEDAAAKMSEGLSGTSVDVEQTSKSSVEAGQVNMVDSAAKSVTASALHMEDSAAGIVRSGSVDVTESAIGLAVGSSVRMQDSNSFVTVSKIVEADELQSVLVVASRVDGDVETVFTPLTALAAGAGLALGLVLFGRSLRWLLTRPFRGLRTSAD
jgi:vacuolar-type H+-ATPase subunit B/Vma2